MFWVSSLHPGSEIPAPPYLNDHVESHRAGHRSPARRFVIRRCPDQTAALPRHPRRQGRLHLRRRPVDGAGERAAPRRASPRIRASRCSPSSRRTASRSPSPASTTATSRSTSMPATGGVPKQLTFYPARGPLTARWGYDNQVYGWTPDGKRSSSAACATAGRWRQPSLHRDAEGGGAVQLPMPNPARAHSRPTASRWSTRRCPATSAPRSATAAARPTTLFIFDLETNDGEADHRRSARRARPDVDRQHHLLQLRPTGTSTSTPTTSHSGQRRQLTHSTTWDVRWPSGRRRPDRLRAERRAAGARHQDRTVHADLDHGADDGCRARPSHVSAADAIEDFALSPKGERALFAARGDIFTAPIEKGPTRNLTQFVGSPRQVARAGRPTARRSPSSPTRPAKRKSRWSRRTAPASPSSSPPAARPCATSPVGRPTASASPSATRTASSTCCASDDKKLIEVADDPRRHDRRLRLVAEGQLPRVQHDGPRQQARRSTSGATATARCAESPTSTSTSQPAWDPDGNYLYFLSDRDSRRRSRTVEFNFARNRTTGIFALALRKDVKHPFPPESDEVKPDSRRRRQRVQGANAKDDGQRQPKAAKDSTARQDRQPRDRLRRHRTARRPGAGGGRQYRRPHRQEGPPALPAVRRASTTAGDNDRKTALRIYSLKDRKETTLADGRQRVRAVAGRLEGPGLQRQHAITLLDATPTGDGSKKTVSTAGPDGRPRAGRGMGADLRRSLAPLSRLLLRRRTCTATTGRRCATSTRRCSQYVAHRSDLNYVIGEMIAELTVQHAYIAGGDLQMPPRPQVALPGARSRSTRRPGAIASRRSSAGRTRRRSIARRSPRSASTRSVGDYVLAIDGEALTGDRRPLPAAAQQGGSAGDADAEPSRQGRRRAQRHASSRSASESDLDLPRLVPARTASGSTTLTGGTRRLHPHPRHGRRRDPRIHQVVLPADPQGRTDRRRPRQRRRQRLADAHRAPAAQAARPSTSPAPTTRRAPIPTASSSARWRPCSTRTRRRTATSSRACSSRPSSGR